VALVFFYKFLLQFFKILNLTQLVFAKSTKSDRTGFIDIHKKIVILTKAHSPYDVQCVDYQSVVLGCAA
jgi:hypothetical protein